MPSTLPTIPVLDTSNAIQVYDACLYLADAAIRMGVSYPDGSGEMEVLAKIAKAALDMAAEIRNQYGNNFQRRFS